MANQELLDIIRQGAAAWQAWLAAKPRREWPPFDLSGADLSGVHLQRIWLERCDLRGARITDADWTGARLSLARLDQADLSWSSFGHTNLGGADLRGSTLVGTWFGGANLSRANFRGANMAESNVGGANLTGADLRFVQLRGATIVDTVFADADLTHARIAECIHKGPSTLDHRTFRRCPDLPLTFLRGCGLPDQFIDYLPSLCKYPIQFDSCFISYSANDVDFANRLHADLQNKGVRCWFAPHDVQGGKKLHEQIDAAIQVHDRLLLILSDASIMSEWVETEIAKARKREIRDGRRMLFPISLVAFDALRHWKCFDADIGKDSAREIREYFIPDFSRWKDHDSYQTAFERLLKDLQASWSTTTSP